MGRGVTMAIGQRVPMIDAYERVTGQISYGLAAFRLDGKPLVAFGATANHCAFYLMSGSMVEAYETDLKDYDTSKGTIRFPADKPLPVALVRKLVKARIAENAALISKAKDPKRAIKKRGAEPDLGEEHSESASFEK